MDGNDNNREHGQNDLVSVDYEPSTDLRPVSTAVPPTGPDGSITWTASEFVSHQKSFMWYLTLGAITAVVALSVLLLTKDKITTSVIIIIAVVMGVMASKKPREVEYRIDNEGIFVGSKKYPFTDFKSFSIIRQGAFSSLIFRPLKRFAFLTSAYYDYADEQKIMDILTMYLPYEERKADFIDEVFWKLRF